MKRNLCQGCVCLAPEKELHIPHDNDNVEKDVEVCVPCYNRISEAIAKDTDMFFSVVGPRILGIRTGSQFRAYDF